MNYKIKDFQVWNKWHPFTKPFKSVSYWMITWQRFTNLENNSIVYAQVLVK